jgi:hypothetical protein
VAGPPRAHQTRGTCPAHQATPIMSTVQLMRGRLTERENCPNAGLGMAGPPPSVGSNASPPSPPAACSRPASSCCRRCCASRACSWAMRRWRTAAATAMVTTARPGGAGAWHCGSTAPSRILSRSRATRCCWPCCYRGRGRRRPPPSSASSLSATQQLSSQPSYSKAT